MERRFDYYGTYQPAQFDEVMPVSAIASQAGCLDAENRADTTFAHLGYQALKTGTLHQA